MQIEKVKDRKPPEGKEKTNAQKVIEWYEKLPANEEFKIGKVLKDTQLTNNQLQNVRKVIIGKAVKFCVCILLFFRFCVRFSNIFLLGNGT